MSNPRNLSELIKQGYELTKQNGIDQLKEMISSNKGVSYPLYFFGIAQLRNGKKEKAQKAFRLGFELEKNIHLLTEEMLNDIIISALDTQREEFNQEKFDHHEAEAKKAIEKKLWADALHVRLLQLRMKPTDVRLHESRMLLFKEGKQYGKALLEAEICSALNNNNNAGFLAHIRDLNLKLNNLDAAIRYHRAMKKLIGEKNNDALFACELYRAGIREFEAGNHDLANTYFLQTIQFSHSCLEVAVLAQIHIIVCDFDQQKCDAALAKAKILAAQHGLEYLNLLLAKTKDAISKTYSVAFISPTQLSITKLEYNPNDVQLPVTEQASSKARAKAPVAAKPPLKSKKQSKQYQAELLRITAEVQAAEEKKRHAQAPPEIKEKVKEHELPTFNLVAVKEADQKRAIQRALDADAGKKKKKKIKKKKLPGLKKNKVEDNSADKQPDEEKNPIIPLAVTKAERALPEDIQFILTTLTESNEKALLCGTEALNHFLDKPLETDDFDVTTTASWELIKDKLAKFNLKQDQHEPKRITLETKPKKTEIWISDELKESLYKDANKRGCNLKAVFVDDKNKKHDPLLRAIKDIKDKVIRTQDALKVYQNDPRHIFKDLKLFVDLESASWKLSKENRKAILQCSDDLSSYAQKSSVILNSQLIKFFTNGNFKRKMELLFTYKIIDTLFPIFAEAVKKNLEWIIEYISGLNVSKDLLLKHIYAAFLICKLGENNLEKINVLRKDNPLMETNFSGMHLALNTAFESWKKYQAKNMKADAQSQQAAAAAAPMPRAASQPFVYPQPGVLPSFGFLNHPRGMLSSAVVAASSPGVAHLLAKSGK